MKCKIVSWLMPEGPPYYANGPVRTISRCETHEWSFEGPAQEICPLGRIDEATDRAIERIKKETEA
jgi:hypothetical protein